MNRNDYNRKVDDVLQKGKYRWVPKAPNSGMERQIYNILKEHEQHFSLEIRSKLTLCHSKGPHLRGILRRGNPHGLNQSTSRNNNGIVSMLCEKLLFLGKRQLHQP